MPVIDLTRYIVASSGIWTDPPAKGDPDNRFGFVRPDTFAPERLLLRWAGDFVALTGPLRVRVTVQSENLTVPLAFVSQFGPNASGAEANPTAQIQAGGLSLQASTIYTYVLDVGAGQAWPFNLSEQLDRLRIGNFQRAAIEQLGNNLGFRVIIEPAFAVADCTPITPSNDLPCDFAVADRTDTARFFPVACEPCDAGVIGLPPSGAVSLVTPPAEGGCVRTRFFNGMFITQEDLETEQRYHRLKSKLHNRAAGAGVVWGLGVGKQGSQVCVLPGYGVDCCGNDLALTTTYRVEIAALIADPAAASLVRQGGGQRLHLLLEYIECPANPRPVHGDPCAPEVSRCEMSRIRESVRLRLVPPRDYDAAKASAPLNRFLAEVRELYKRFSIDPVANVQGLTRAPFTLDIQITASEETQSLRISGLRPPFETGTLLKALVNKKPTSIRISVRPDPLWTLVGGTLYGEALTERNAALPELVRPPSKRDLSLGESVSSKSNEIEFVLDPQKTEQVRQLVFRLSGWQAQHVFAAETDPSPSGDFTLTMTINDNTIQEVSLSEEPISLRSFQPGPTPCSGEPCVPRRRSQASDLFEPVKTNFAGQATTDPTPVLPWLHTDPQHPGASGDPKALILAAIGGWLMQLRVRDGEGTVHGVNSARRQLAQAIYRLAWLLLYGLGDKEVDPAVLGKTLQRLLEGWCDAFLWKGPECCGEPHGVVIGCALVEGGTIQCIDPFGGRRHVVHYPLLSHWGAQLGLAPLDLSLNRLFAKLCCIAGLPALDGQSGEPPRGLVAMGPGFVAIGSAASMQAQLDERQFKIIEKRSATMAEVVAEALALFGRRSPKPTDATGDTTRTFRALVLADVVAAGTVVLLVPQTDFASGEKG